MEVAIEKPPPVKEETNRADAKPEMQIGRALPIVFESFQSAQRTASIKQQDEDSSSSSLEAAKAEMGVVREENERLKTMLSRIVSEYQSLQMHFRDVVKLREEQQATAAKATTTKVIHPVEEPAQPAAAEADADDLVCSLTLGGARTSNGGVHRKGHDRTSSSSGTTAGDDDSTLSLGLRFSSRGPAPATDDETTKASRAGPVLNLSSDGSSSANDDDDTAKPAGESLNRKSPSGERADDEVQQQAKKTRVSVRVKCDTPTMNDGCQWRKYGQKISKGNPCPRAYYRCTVAPNCPVRKQVQRCADDKSILITTYEGSHNHQLPPAATAMASTTSAAAAMLTSGSTSSAALVGRHGHLPLASAGLLGGPTTMVSSTGASCPTITLDLTAPAGPHSLMHSSASPYAAAAGYESKALPAAWSSGYPAYGHQPPSYYAAKSSPAMMGHHLFGGQLGVPSSRPDQLFGGQSSSYLQRSSSLGAAAAPKTTIATDTLAKAITSDPSFQTVLAAVITSYMGRGGGGEATQK